MPDPKPGFLGRIANFISSYFSTSKTKDASTQTDASETGSTETSETSSVNQRGTQGASTQTDASETASQLSGASTAPTQFGSFSKKLPKVLVGGNDTKVREWLNNGDIDVDIDVTKKELAEQAIMAEVMKAQYAMEKKLKEEQEAKLTLQEEEYRQAQMESESNRASTDRKAQKTAHSQATAKAEVEAYAARIVASAARIAYPNKLGLDKAPIAIAPEPEGRIVPENLPEKRVRFDPKEIKTWDGPEAEKPPTQTSKKVPKNKGEKKVTIQDPRTAWQREMDEFREESKAGAVKRKEQIEENRNRIQKAKEAFWSSHDTFGFENPDLQEKRLLAYAQANGLNQTQTKALRKRMGEESGLDYGQIIASREGSSKDANPDSSRVGNPPHPDGHAGLQNLTKKKEEEHSIKPHNKPSPHQYGGYQTPSRPARPIIPQPTPPSRTR